MAHASDVRAPESGLEILLVGSSGDASEVAISLRDRGACVENVPPDEAAHAALVRAPDVIVLMGDAAVDGGEAVLRALAAKSATSVTPVVVVRASTSAPAPATERPADAPVASLGHASPTLLATRVLELASHLTTREGSPALRALFAPGRAPKQSGARVIVPTPSALESEGVDTAEIATLPESEPPTETAEAHDSIEMPRPPSAKAKIVPFVPTARYGTIDLPFDDQLPVDSEAPTDLYERPMPLVAEKSAREMPEPARKVVAASRRRAVGRSMKIDKNPIEPATSIRPTEVDLLVVGAARAVSTDRYERVTPRPAPRAYLAAALLAAIAIIASAIFVHASRVTAPTSVALPAAP